MAAFKDSLIDLCCRSSIPTDCGRYRAEYWTLMFSFVIISFQRFEMKDAPLSEVTKLGTPKRANQLWRKAEAAASEVASLSGTAWTNLVVLQTQVSRNL